MNRISTIGRDPQCDIIIQDMTDVVSRVHAVLKLEPNGKMFIKDQSKNGTYINGMRVTPNVEIPISRKDSISFANVRELDWSVIPNPMKKKVTILSFTSLGLVVAGLLTWIILGTDIFKPETQVIIQTDSITVPGDTVRDTIIREVPVQPKASKKTQKEEPKEDTVKVTGTEHFI